VSESFTRLAVISHDGRVRGAFRRAASGLYDLIEFDSAIAFLEALQNDTTFDLLAVDLHLSDIDGWRLTRLLRSSEFWGSRPVPLLVLSSVFSSQDLLHISNSLGANAWLSFPCDDDAVKAAMLQSLEQGAHGENRVALVVEDDPSSMVWTKTALEQEGYTVIAASTGMAAQEAFASQTPDVVIVDHRLPDTTGLTLLGEWCPRIDVGRCIFLAVTGDPSPALAAQYVRVGVDAFIAKPFSIAQLLTAISGAQSARTLQNVESLLELRTYHLSEAEQNLLDIHEATPLGNHTLDEAGTILSMNAVELQWLGYDEDEIVGKKTIFDLQNASSRERGVAALERLIRDGELRNLELSMIRKDGSVLPVSVQSRAVYGTDGRFSFARSVCIDITNRKRLEHEVAHRRQMDASNVMAQGIAHNFNNLLTPILVNAAELLNDCEEGSEDRELLADIVQAATHGAELVKQLAALGGSRSKRRVPVDLTVVVRQVIAGLQRSLPTSVRIVTHLTAEHPSVLGNLGEMQQMLMILCENAAEAMPSGGVLTVSLADHEVADDSPTLACSDVSYVRISVSDTGTGMDSETIDRAFDPFFTTKGLAIHTGLGLSTLDVIAKRHEGFVDIDSREGQGTTLHVDLPSIPHTEAEVPPTEEPPDETRAALTSRESSEGAHILIVDDERAVRWAAARALKRDGFVTTEVNGGADAMALLHGPEGPSIDLVLLDIVMPGRSGKEVLQDIRGVWPHLPVVIMSGGSDHAGELADEVGGASTYAIEKPFQKVHLLRTVHTALAAREPMSPPDLT
jgi:PAS domain S-box-containing protein